jgi:multidrug efflux pump subunit AcrA (membrane-fusion protein)
MKNKSSIGLWKAAAALLALIAGASGCQQPTQVAAKSLTPVRVVDVALNSSSESLRYSASVLPLAQAALSFKSSGYVTEIKQVMGADGRRREIGAGDYVARGALLAQIRHQDLKNQLDQAAAAVTPRRNISKLLRITNALRRFTPRTA